MTPELSFSSSFWRSAVQLAAASCNGATSVGSIVGEAIAHALACDAAFISENETRALNASRAAAAQWRERRPASLLDGVPIAWRDLFDVAGSVTTAGSALFRDCPPATEDAPLVAAGSRAGFVSIGKTNLSEFAYSGLGLNPHFGAPFNLAFDTTIANGGHRVPDDSSSGAATVVAAGVVPIAGGADTAGSILVPAALNGLVEYRASGARYPRQGMIGLSKSADTCESLACGVADCAAFDAAARGCDLLIAPSDLHGAHFVVPRVSHHDPSGRFRPRSSAADARTSHHSFPQARRCAFQHLRRNRQRFPAPAPAQIVIPIA